MATAVPSWKVVTMQFLPSRAVLARSAPSLAHVSATEAASRPGQAPAEVVAVVLADDEPTLAALRFAAQFLRSTQVLTLLAMSPVISGGGHRVGRLLDQAGIDASTRLLACPDVMQLPVPRGSPIIIGVRGRWWPDRARRLASVLVRQGHRVLVVPAG
jgi:hypothetical protein